MKNKILLYDFLSLMYEEEILILRIRNVYVENVKQDIEVQEENTECFRKAFKDLNIYVETFFYSKLYNAFIIKCINED